MTAVSKAIAIIKNSRTPSVSIEGVFMARPTASELKKNLPNATQRQIWLDAYNDLEVLNRHFKSLMPHLLAYSREMAQYHILSETAGEQVTDEYRGDERINPLLVQANRCLKNAMDLYKQQLCLDPVSRHRLGISPGAKPKKSKTEEFKI